MSELRFFLLGSISVVEIQGVDAAVIVNNLTTNEVVSLSPGEGRETFVTDVRGKTIGHVGLFRLAEAIRLIGPDGQSSAIAAHMDRYTIREDATPVIRDDDFVAVALTPAAAEALGIEMSEVPIAVSTITLAGQTIDLCMTRWLGEATPVLLIPPALVDSVTESLADQSVTPADLNDFHVMRIGVRFPWYGIDMDGSNFPQELDRDDQAISFTKGCYLGQETVARIDAVGQVQRKLVRWKLALPESRQSDLTEIAAGMTLAADGKTVGRLTSVGRLNDGNIIALGFARRSHFDAGAEATEAESGSREPIRAIVW